jgi:hypothetical protein
MKKITLAFIIVILLFVSCNASLQLLDEDGFSIYQCGWALDDNQILIQSHDGFIIDDIYYTEHISSYSALIINPLNHEIYVKLTYDNTYKWIAISAESYYSLDLLEEEDDDWFGDK